MTSPTEKIKWHKAIYFPIVLTLNKAMAETGDYETLLQIPGRYKERR